MSGSPTILGIGLANFYSSNLTLIQATLLGMVLAASVQVALKAGVFSLASVGFWGVGAYTSGILVRDHGVGVAGALLGALALSSAVA